MADITESSIVTTSSNTGTGTGAGTGQVNEPPTAIRRTTTTTAAPSTSKPPPHQLSLSDLLRSSVCNTYDKLRAKPALAGKIAAAVSFVFAALTLWLAFAATSDTRKATLLAEWTASKDFFELCESHNWEIHPGCLAAKDSPPGPPPVAVINPRDSETPRWPPPLVPRNADHSQTVPVPGEEYWRGEEYDGLVLALLLATGAVLIFLVPMDDYLTYTARLIERNADLRRQYGTSIGYTPDSVFPRPLHGIPFDDLRYRDRRSFPPPRGELI